MKYAFVCLMIVAASAQELEVVPLTPIETAQLDKLKAQYDASILAYMAAGAKFCAAEDAARNAHHVEAQAVSCYSGGSSGVVGRAIHWDVDKTHKFLVKTVW